MKRIVVVLGVAAVMAAIVVLMAGAALAQAETETVSERIPFSIEAVNECTGEPFTMEGTFHIVTHFTVNENGAHGLDHFSVQGQGVSPSGARYVIVSVDQLVSNLSTRSGEFVEQTHTVSIHGRVLRQGEDGTEEDLMSRSIFHVTQNANGEFTAVVENFEIECR